MCFAGAWSRQLKQRRGVGSISSSSDNAPECWVTQPLLAVALFSSVSAAAASPSGRSPEAVPLT